MELSSLTSIKEGLSYSASQAAVLPFIIGSRLGRGRSFDPDFAKAVGLDNYCGRNLPFLIGGLTLERDHWAMGALHPIDSAEVSRASVIMKSIGQYCPESLENIQALSIQLTAHVSTPGYATTIFKQGWTLEETLNVLARTEPSDLTAYGIIVRPNTSSEIGDRTRHWLKQVANAITSSGLLEYTLNDTDLETNRLKYLGLGRFLAISLIHETATGIASDPELTAILLGSGSAARSNWSLITEGFRSVIPTSVTDALRITPEKLARLIDGEPTDADSVIPAVYYPQELFGGGFPNRVHRKNWLESKLAAVSHDVLETFLYKLTFHRKRGIRDVHPVVHFVDSPVALEIRELELYISTSAPASALDEAFDTLFRN